MRGCAHAFCVDCLGSMITTAVRNSTEMLPIRCCGHEVSPSHIHTAMPPKLSNKYHQLLLERTGKHTMFCPAQKCSQFLALDGVKGAVDTEPVPCPKCKSELCVVCRSWYHHGLSCVEFQWKMDRVQDPVLAYCRKQGWMRCGDCGQVIEKKAGCNHMRCSCGRSFCYLCGSAWGGCKCEVIGRRHHDIRQSLQVAQTARFVCPCCNQACDSRAELEVHVRMRHHTCRYCREPFQTTNLLAAHKREAHHICRFCHQDFPSEEVMQQHKLEVHTCAVCKKPFSKHRELAAHMTRAHPGHQPHTCPVVTKYSSDDTNEVCGAKFPLKSALIKHMQDQHPTTMHNYNVQHQSEVGCEPLQVADVIPIVDMSRAMPGPSVWDQTSSQETAPVTANTTRVL